MIDMAERIQKIIASSGYCSRRTAEKLIKEGKVSINNKVACIGESVETTDNITIDGNPIPLVGSRTYIMLNKPRGFITTMSDDKGRSTVADLVKNVSARVVPVGRLDADSEGLLIMTDDGDLIYKLEHPSHLVEKTYQVRVEGSVNGEKVEALRKLCKIGNEIIRPAAEVLLLKSNKDSSLLRITITEGKNRQIRRMCGSIGLNVARLKRVSQAGIKLESVDAGSWRYLSDEEIGSLKKI